MRPRRRIEINPDRVRFLIKDRGLQWEDLEQPTRMKAGSLKTQVAERRLMPQTVAAIAKLLDCSSEYLTGEAYQPHRITCQTCKRCRKYEDINGKRLICTKWHIYKVNPADHCSWGTDTEEEEE